METLNSIKQAIEQADTICIFRHMYPDQDALGSQLGMQRALQALYPQKQIYVLGTSTPEAQMGQVEDEIVKNSTAIILDTANRERIDDQRALSAKEIIRIDHHVPVETIGQIEWIDEKASATCELLALYFEQMKQPIPAKAAQKLYEGLIADNIRFTTSNVRRQSFEAGGYLVSQGADVQLANEHNYAITLKDFYYENEVRNKAVYKDHTLTAILSIEDYKKHGMEFAEAKEKVYVLSNIEEVKTWALFTEKEPNVYNASLRSKTLDIRQIATQYHGGGHQCASGIKDLSLQQVRKIIEQLIQVANEEG